jgi:hypothetical protein
MFNLSAVFQALADVPFSMGTAMFSRQASYGAFFLSKDLSMQIYIHGLEQG